MIWHANILNAHRHTQCKLTHSNNDSHKAPQPHLPTQRKTQLLLWRKIIQSGRQIRLWWIKHSKGDFSTLNTKKQPARLVSTSCCTDAHGSLQAPPLSSFLVFISWFVQRRRVPWHTWETAPSVSLLNREIKDGKGEQEWDPAEREQTLFSRCSSSGPLHRLLATSVRRWQDLVFLFELVGTHLWECRWLFLVSTFTVMLNISRLPPGKQQQPHRLPSLQRRFYFTLMDVVEQRGIQCCYSSFISSQL